MKKIWKNYSYTIVLVALSLIATIIINYNLPSTDQYMTITVQDGESLWKISKKYEDQHNLSDKQFIEWVEKNNGIARDHIIAGKNLIIPITNEPIELEEIHNLASQ
ncbi:cell division suppressor protein YneA [Niallia sp. Krafla_26]|uniref:cell division suppressor protein YneA n=1 Tax=Niallia sp. Krafla_26 TaxID=3064703 RepID=UPI003D16F54F